MNVHQLAAQHSAHLTREDRDLFMLAFNAGRAVIAQPAGLSVDDDREHYVRTLISEGRFAAAAGFLEGVAATRPTVPVAQPRRSYQRAAAI